MQLELKSVLVSHCTTNNPNASQQIPSTTAYSRKKVHQFSPSSAPSVLYSLQNPINIQMCFPYISKNRTPQLPPDPIFPDDYCTISSLPLVARLVASNYSPLILSYTSSVEIVPHYYTKLVLSQVH